MLVPRVAFGDGSARGFWRWFRVLLLVLVPRVASGVGSVCCFWWWFRVLLLVLVPRVAFGVGSACCFWCWFRVLLLVASLEPSPNINGKPNVPPRQAKRNPAEVKSVYMDWVELI